MKKFAVNILFFVGIIPFLVQCASQNDVEELRYQLRIVNKKIEDMKSTTIPMQKRQAAVSGQMDQLEKEILELKGQLDETHYLNRKLKEQNKDLEASISNVAQEESAKREEAMRRLEEALREKEMKLAEKMNQQQESVKAIQEARLKEAERKAKETALMAELAKKKTQAANITAQPEGGSAKHVTADKKKEKKDVSTATTPDSTETKQAMPATASTKDKAIQPTPAPSAMAEPSDNNMKKAQKLFEKNNYAEALPLFEQIAGNSSSSDSVEARYLMGECLFNQKEYDKAIMQYQKIISQSSGHEKASSAMLKQGMAFEKLSDKETAKVIYKKLLKKHGSSREAGIAQERLGKL
ncbi:MAG: tetratricopeptide repeat protein [Proteobacteria bacterium]|nr:tetratricopeptide repeat protein [Pseudomonadota bacterium]